MAAKMMRYTRGMQTQKLMPVLHSLDSRERIAMDHRLTLRAKRTTLSSVSVQSQRKLNREIKRKEPLDNNNQRYHL